MKKASNGIDTLRVSALSKAIEYATKQAINESGASEDEVRAALIHMSLNYLHRAFGKDN